jgi:hypothetical protein
MMRHVYVFLLMYLLLFVLPDNIHAGWQEARAAVESAKIYATAIVIAGALIGVGLYLGLRQKKNQE